MLKQGQRVFFHVGALRGEGQIVGIACSPQPVIGYTYIIEPDISIRNEVYDYSHFVANETMLNVLDQESE